VNPKVKNSFPYLEIGWKMSVAHHCTPPVTVPDVIEGLAVWWHSTKKKKRAACRGAAADCNGEWANDSAEITIQGSSPAPILRVARCGSGAKAPPLAAPRRPKFILFTMLPQALLRMLLLATWKNYHHFINISTLSFCFLEQFRVKNLTVLQSGRFKA